MTRVNGKRPPRRTARKISPAPITTPAAPRSGAATQPPGTANGHQHAEAFCLMQYSDDSGQVLRYIWNSRDGVTPFGCADPATGAELKHINWRLDSYQPDRIPAVGDLIWVDLNPERALQLAERQVEHWWDDEHFPMREQFASKLDAARMLVQSYFEHGTPPDLVTVTEPLRDWFLAEKASA